MDLTHHSIKRMHARIGVTKGIAKKHAKKVLVNGIQHKDTIGELNQWMNKEFLRYHTANNMRYYAGRLYIFRDELLITVLNEKPEIEHNLSLNVKPDVLEKYLQHRKNKNKKKIEKIEKEIIEYNILQALKRYTEEQHKEIIICNVYFIKPHVVRVTYVSDSHTSDWMKHTDIIEFLKKNFGVGVYLTKIKDKNHKYVTRQKWLELINLRNP